MHGKDREGRETCDQINLPATAAEAVVLDGDLRPWYCMGRCWTSEVEEHS